MSVLLPFYFSPLGLSFDQAVLLGHDLLGAISALAAFGSAVASVYAYRAHRVVQRLEAVARVAEDERKQNGG